MYVFCTYKTSMLYGYLLYLGMKTERKEIRLSEEMLKRMEKRASQLGLNVSAYINYCIAKELDDAAKASA